MKVFELFDGALTEAESAEVDMVIDKFVDMLFEEGEAAIGGDPSPTQAPTTPAGPGGAGGGGPTQPPPAPQGDGHMHGGWGGGNKFASAWFATFASQLMWLSSASRIKKRLKELGLKGEGARRLQNSITIANQNIGLLLNNPGWRQQNWTFAGGPGATQSKKIASSMSKLLGKEIKKAAKPHKKKIREGLDEGWKSNVVNAAATGALLFGGAAAIKSNAAKVAPTIAHVVGDERSYLPAKASPPNGVKVKTGTAKINGKEVKVKYWSQRDMKYTNHYYERD